MNLKSHFQLDNKKRSGILFLIAILICSWWVYFSLGKIEQESISDSEALLIQRQIDSLRNSKAAEETIKIFPFNPNFITDYKGYTLGLSPEEIDKLLAYRSQNLWINSASDFQTVTGVSDSLLATISPYFKFPDWVKNAQSKKSNTNSAYKSSANKRDLNSATFADLSSLPNFTNESARLVLNYRKKIGGFLEDDQLYDIYNLKRVQVFEVKKEFTVKTKPNIDRLNVNEANASDLATIPFVTFDIARSIIDYRILNEGIVNLDELLKIEGITAYKLDRIKLYLSTNQ